MAALDHILQPILHIVAQVVEAEFVVSAVGDVARVGFLALAIIHAVHDDASRKAEEVVDLTHPLGVAFGEIVVDGDNVNTEARQRVEIDRQRGDQRFAFAGFHFGDFAFVQDHAADQLHIEMALPDGALRRFAHRGEGRHQHVVERCAVGDLLLEVGGARPERLVGERGYFRLERIDGIDPRLVALDPPVIGGAEQLAGNGADHRQVLVWASSRQLDAAPV